MEKKQTLGKGLIIIIYLALKPIYLQSSGTLQICDVFFIFMSGYLLVNKKGKFRIKKGLGDCVKLFVGLCVYQTIINLAWTAVTGENVLRSSLYYIFNFIAFFDCLIIGREIGIQKLKRSLVIGSLISLIITSVGLMVSYGTSGRLTGFFNNPNQLGYYALLIFVFIFLCWDKNSILVKAVMIAMTIWAVIASASKAAFIGMVFTAIFYVLLSNEKCNLKQLVLQIVFVLGIASILYMFFFSTSSFILSNDTLLFMRKRILTMGTESDSALGAGRGYDRVKEMGIHLLWGMGEGAYGRFEVMTNMEIHSTYASLLVSYGVIGLVGYFILFCKCVVKRRNLVLNFSLLSGVLFYQLSHNGIRNTLIWILLAVFLLENHSFKQDVNIIIGDQL